MKFTGKVELKKGMLEKLNAEFAKSGDARVHVGVLKGQLDREAEVAEGEYGPGQKSELSNADIGAVHELGSKTGGIPRRSFLKMPIEGKVPAKLKEIGPEKMVGLIVEKGVVEGLRVVGVLGEQVVDEAFASRGFGTWAPNSEATIEAKGSDAPLIDTAKLRRSVTSNVYDSKGQPA